MEHIEWVPIPDPERPRAVVYWRAEKGDRAVGAVSRDHGYWRAHAYPLGFAQGKAPLVHLGLHVARRDAARAVEEFTENEEAEQS